VMVVVVVVVITAMATIIVMAIMLMTIRIWLIRAGCAVLPTIRRGRFWRAVLRPRNGVVSPKRNDGAL
jgi:hypothetical protein